MKLLIYSLLLTTLATPVLSHDWYESDCCNEKDCRPAKEGEVVRYSSNGLLGYLVRVPDKGIHEFVPDSDDRIRETPFFAETPIHVCILDPSVYNEGGWMHPSTDSNQLLCVYVRKTYF